VPPQSLHDRLAEAPAQERAQRHERSAGLRAGFGDVKVGTRTTSTTKLCTPIDAMSSLFNPYLIQRLLAAPGAPVLTSRSNVIVAHAPSKQLAFLLRSACTASRGRRYQHCHTTLTRLPAKYMNDLCSGRLWR
jgi:hypothetical protein